MDLNLESLKAMGKKEMERRSQEEKALEANLRPQAVLFLLRYYHSTRMSVEDTVDQTVRLLKENEYQQFMSQEYSGANERLRRTVRQTDSTVDLWNEFCGVLEAFRQECERSAGPHMKDVYRLLYLRYLRTPPLGNRAVEKEMKLSHAKALSLSKEGVHILAERMFGNTDEEKMWRIVHVLQEMGFRDGERSRLFPGDQ